MEGLRLGFEEWIFQNVMSGVMTIFPTKEFWIWFIDNLTKVEGLDLWTNLSWGEAQMVTDLEFAFIVDTVEEQGLQKETEMVQVVFRKMNLADE